MASKPRMFDTKFAYHIYNCGAGKQRIFETSRDYNKFLEIIAYYRFKQPNRFSHIERMSASLRQDYFERHPETKEKERLLILAYCVMPNHFHFLIRTVPEYNPSEFMADIANSYTRYFNTKNERVGSLLQGTFKSKLVRDNGSVINVSRYIHLNPFKSAKTNPNKELRLLDSYPYSSFRFWRKGEADKIINIAELENWLKLAGGREKYYKFVCDSADKPVHVGIEDLVIEKSSE